MGRKRFELSDDTLRVIQAYRHEAGLGTDAAALRAVVLRAAAEGLLQLPEAPGDEDAAHLQETLREVGRRAEADALQLAWTVVRSALLDPDRAGRVRALREACLQILHDVPEEPEGEVAGA